MLKSVLKRFKKQSWIIQVLFIVTIVAVVRTISNTQQDLNIVLTFIGGLTIGLIATTMFSQKALKQKNSTEWQKQHESLKNIQSLIDDLSKKAPLINNTSSTITKDAPPPSPIPHCAIIMKDQSLEGYVIPYTIDGESVYYSNSKQGVAFRNALRLLKQKGHNFNVLKPRGTLGNFISKNRTQNANIDPRNQLEFPVNLMSNN
jgi:hypothetical protein